MADAGKRKVDYIPELGVSYIDYGDGRAETVQGDQRANPMYMEAEVKSGPRLKPTKVGAERSSSAGKDLMVNLASQLPMAIPGLGLVPRAALSLAAGTGADQLASKPDKPASESFGEAAINSLLGGITEGLAGGTLKMKMPVPTIGMSGGGWGNRFGASLHGLSPIEFDPMVPNGPGMDMFDLLKTVPPTVTRGPGGKFLTNAALKNNRAVTSTAKQKIVKDAIKKLVKYNIIPGTAINQLLDMTMNTPTSEDK